MIKRDLGAREAMGPSRTATRWTGREGGKVFFGYFAGKIDRTR